MPEFPAISPSPARVHERVGELTGHQPHWRRQRWRGEWYCRNHYRTCSFCGSIHPGDMIAMLRSGRSRLEECGKAAKRILITPNPIAGRMVRMGSISGRVFDHWPVSLRERLSADASQSELDPSIGERLSGHFERALLEPAPAEIEQPFFLNHTHDAQWFEIIAAIKFGERHAPLSRA